MIRILLWLLTLLWLLPLAAPQRCLAMPAQGFYPAPDQPVCPACRPDPPDPVRAPGPISGAGTSTPFLTAKHNLPGEQPLRTRVSGDEFRYTGEQWDPNAGFHYLRARWMEPTKGRFASADPHPGTTAIPQTMHRYVYGFASPVNGSDPSGRNTMLLLMATITVSSAIAAYAIPKCEPNLDCRSCLRRFWQSQDDEEGASRSVAFRFRVKRGPCDPHACCLVQFVRGSWVKIATNDYRKASILGELTDVNFDDWVIDSRDADPVYKSEPGSRWNYDKIDERTYEATDAPGPFKAGERIRLDFEMCIYNCDDVPSEAKNLDASSMMFRAIKCIPWEVKMTHHADGTVTHP